MQIETPSGNLKLGIHTPIVIQTPGGHARWEEPAGAEELRRVVVTADRLGYHHLTCSEHIAVPDAQRKWRGVVYWDPVAFLGWAAALTTEILLATNVVVLGYDHPVELLKRYATIDQLSGGRVILGVGVGTLQEEFALLGADFEDRGPRADEELDAILAGWGRSDVRYQGDYFSYDQLIVEPHSPRKEPRIWVGGSTRRSLRRALTVGHGWTPFGLPPDRILEMLASSDLPPGFDVILPSGPLDPKGSPDQTAGMLGELARCGATGAHAAFVHHSLDDYLEQLEALAEMAQPGRGRGS
ncbi:MAG TPA: TIGR03619 family F420-dependent LLM class oxidoreductase [Acidimicrobiales bacterium]|nr:TIGR03619 family F420-dependent LLM class oxidoreductase [Acidimicrobiales bacterium]